MLGCSTSHCQWDVSQKCNDPDGDCHRGVASQLLCYTCDHHNSQMLCLQESSWKWNMGPSKARFLSNRLLLVGVVRIRWRSFTAIVGNTLSCLDAVDSRRGWCCLVFDWEVPQSGIPKRRSKSCFGSHTAGVGHPGRGSRHYLGRLPGGSSKSAAQRVQRRPFWVWAMESRLWKPLSVEVKGNLNFRSEPLEVANPFFLKDASC